VEVSCNLKGGVDQKSAPSADNFPMRLAIHLH